METELSLCPSCRHDVHDKLHQVKSIYSGGFLTLVRCQNCQLVFVNPRPVQSDLLKFYGSEYYGISSFERAYASRSQKRLAAQVMRLRPPCKVMDIGCGKGGFMVELEKRGWEVYGSDPSTSACAITRRRIKAKDHVYCGNVENLQLPKLFFDILTMWTVLEHIPVPLETLKVVHDLLNDDGILVIEAPNLANPLYWITKGRYFQLQTAPVHLNFFSIQTLTDLLRRTGFTVFKIDSTALFYPSNFVQSFKNVVKSRAGVKRTLLLCLLSPLAAVSFIIRLFSIYLPIPIGEDIRIYCKKSTSR